MPKRTNSHSANWAQFQGYKSPNYTQVPDQLFDEHLAFLSGAELKVLLYIVRRTFGFKRDSDNISLSQMLEGITTRDGRILDHGVGLSKKTLLAALRSLQEKNLILAERRQSDERGNEPTSYSLNMGSDPLGGNTTPPLGEKVHQGVGNKTPPSPWGKNSPTQETVLQETVDQETDRHYSNIRKGQTQNKKHKAGDRKRGAVLDGTGPSDVVGALIERSSDGTKSAPPATPHSLSSDASGSSTRGFRSVGDLLDSRDAKGAPRGSTTRQKAYPEDRQQILAYIEDFARELNDEAPLPSSVSRAYNLWQHSGIPIDAFTSLMYEARSLTWEYTANITKTKQPKEGERSVWGPEKNRMAYYFSILEQLVRRSTPGREDPVPTPDGEVSESRGEVEQDTVSDTPQSPVGPVSQARRPVRRHRQVSPALTAYIADLAEEFGDRADAPAYLSEAWSLYEQSELPEDAFLQVLGIARTMTVAVDGGESGDKMSTLLTVVREQLGLASEHSQRDAT